MNLFVSLLNTVPACKLYAGYATKMITKYEIWCVKKDVYFPLFHAIYGKRSLLKNT